MPFDDDDRSPWTQDGLVTVRMINEEYRGPTDTQDHHDYHLSHLLDMLVTHSDASYADNLCNRWSTTGSAHMLWGGLIHYVCRLQTTLALSSTEAELGANTDSGKITIWTRHILGALGVPLIRPAIILVDNEVADRVHNQDGTTKDFVMLMSRSLLCKNGLNEKYWKHRVRYKV